MSFGKKKDMLAQIIRALVAVDIEDHGVLLDIVHKLQGANRHDTRILLRQLARGELNVRLKSEESTDQMLTVEADLAFEERIKRGHYSWRNSDLIERLFPVTSAQIGCWEWRLWEAAPVDVIRLMKEDGYEPGAIGHILAFGESFPDVQRKYPIIGLGSVAEVGLDRVVPGLWGDNGGRRLRLDRFDGHLGDLCRFLGVRQHQVA